MKDIIFGDDAHEDEDGLMKNEEMFPITKLIFCNKNTLRDF